MVVMVFVILAFCCCCVLVFFKQKTAYEMRISDWSSDVCSSDLQLNASFTFALANGLELGVWGRNLTNALYLSTIFPAVAQAGSVSGYPSQPRTYGVTGRFKF